MKTINACAHITVRHLISRRVIEIHHKRCSADFYEAKAIVVAKGMKSCAKTIEACPHPRYTKLHIPTCVYNENYIHGERVVSAATIICEASTTNEYWTLRNNIFVPFLACRLRPGKCCQNNNDCQKYI